MKKKNLSVDNIEWVETGIDHEADLGNWPECQIWTLVTADDGYDYVVTGRHRVNRVNYWVSAKAFESYHELRV